MPILPWYEEVSGKQLMQGDFIPNCNVIIPIEQSGENKLTGEIKIIDCIILSQSCDLLKKNNPSVIVCEYLSFSNYIKNAQPPIESRGKAKDAFENMRKGFLYSYHLLNKSDEYNLEYNVVSFKDIYSIPYNILENSLLEKRIRILSPYREHLSQSFARYFMRVGLPSDIKSEDIPKELTFQKI